MCSAQVWVSMVSSGDGGHWHIVGPEKNRDQPTHDESLMKFLIVMGEIPDSYGELNTCGSVGERSHA